MLLPGAFLWRVTGFGLVKHPHPLHSRYQRMAPDLKKKREIQQRITELKKIKKKLREDSEGKKSKKQYVLWCLHTISHWLLRLYFQWLGFLTFQSNLFTYLSAVHSPKKSAWREMSASARVAPICRRKSARRCACATQCHGKSGQCFVCSLDVVPWTWHSQM